MVNAMLALRKRKSLIMDTCEIFVKEPLLDWVKDAKQRQQVNANNKNDESASAVMAGSMMSEYEEELQELAWYPRKKVEVVKWKLNGYHPVKVVERELKDSRHEKKVSFLCDYQPILNLVIPQGYYVSSGRLRRQLA